MGVLKGAYAVAVYPRQTGGRIRQSGASSVYYLGESRRLLG